MRILAICGSLQARSRNLALLSAAAASIPAVTNHRPITAGIHTFG